MGLSDEEINKILESFESITVTADNSDEQKFANLAAGILRHQLTSLCREVLAARRMRDQLLKLSGPFGPYLDFEDAKACAAIDAYDLAREGNE